MIRCSNCGHAGAHAVILHPGAAPSETCPGCRMCELAGTASDRVTARD